MFDAVIRPACRTKPLPAAGDLPFGAVACGIPSCGSPPTSGHSLRHCCAGRYTAAPAGARAEDAAAHRGSLPAGAGKAAVPVPGKVSCHCRSYAYLRICRQSGAPYLSG